MDQQEMLRCLHKHYVAWLAQGQWQPELAMPAGCYPETGEWMLLEWRFSDSIPAHRWEAAERTVEACFSDICEVWAICRDRKVSALAMANPLSTPARLAGVWVAATDAAEEIQRANETAVACLAGAPAGSYHALTDASPADLSTWWTAHCALPPQERREHRKRIQNYLKKGQYGHIGGYVARCLKREPQTRDGFWFWIPLLMESLWLQQSPPMAVLTRHLDMQALEREGVDAVVTWVRKTCAELKTTAEPEDPIRRVTESIRKDCSLPYSQANLAEGLGLTPAYFSRLFEKRTGIRFSAYLTQERIRRAKALLREGASLTEAAQASGFQRKSYFCEVFRKHTGITAGRYRTQYGKGEIG